MQERVGQGANPRNQRIRPRGAKTPPAEWLISPTICSPLPPSGTRASRPVPTNREIVSKSVDEFLPVVIERLKHAGLTGEADGAEATAQLGRFESGRDCSKRRPKSHCLK